MFVRRFDSTETEMETREQKGWYAIEISPMHTYIFLQEDLRMEKLRGLKVSLFILKL